MNTFAIEDDFFRHEYGRLTAVLSSRVGIQLIDDIEDAVQSAMLKALDHWTRSGTPDNPSAWLFRVAYHQLLDDLRTQSRRRKRLQHQVNTSRHSNPSTDVFFAEEIDDDLLRMLLACCDEDIPIASQITFALKTLCGFSVREIAHRLFASEKTIYKRLERAREKLRHKIPPITECETDQVSLRGESIRNVLYLLFNEGYLSTDNNQPIRRELCSEAIRLTSFLANHPAGQSPENAALFALMHLHATRLDARQHGTLGLLLLEEQDRATWDQRKIQIGLQWLQQSAQGKTFSRYHAEAGIAAEHCLAPSFEATRWDKIAEYYLLLEQITQSPIHKLNRAVAVAEWRGPKQGLALLDGFSPPTWLTGSYLWASVLADLNGRCGNHQAAKHHREIAFKLAPTQNIQKLLRRRLTRSASPRI